jgi:hypothetical protein
MTGKPKRLQTNPMITNYGMIVNSNMIENQERQPIVTNYRNPRATQSSHITGNPRETIKTDNYKRILKLERDWHVPFWLRAGWSLERQL